MSKGSKRTRVGWVVALALIGAAGVVLAQGAEEGAPDYREKIMSINGASMGAIGDILKFKLPGGTEHIAAHAETIHRESQLIAKAFETQAMSDESRALPTVWQQWDKFVAAADNLGEASAKLAEVAKGGDQGAIMAQVKVVGQACGNCHDTFRKPNE
jgi:cytochrome c556